MGLTRAPFFLFPSITDYTPVTFSLNYVYLKRGSTPLAHAKILSCLLQPKNHTGVRILLFICHVMNTIENLFTHRNNSIFRAAVNPVDV